MLVYTDGFTVVGVVAGIGAVEVLAATVVDVVLACFVALLHAAAVNIMAEITISPRHLVLTVRYLVALFPNIDIEIEIETEYAKHATGPGHRGRTPNVRSEE